jgi:HAD superfamily hydrolase (TIGR01549 family)
MMKKAIKAIVWDLDGTLIDFKIDYIRSRNKAIEILKNYNVSQEILTVKSSILENINQAKKFFEKAGFSEKKIKKILTEIDKEIIKIEREAALEAKLITGIDRVLEFAKSRNLKQAIFTFNTKKNTLISLKKAKISQFFDFIVGRDNIDNLKPHPDHLYHICEKLNVNPDEVLVIGDTDRDIEAAINVGAHSIALNTIIPKLIKQEAFSKAEKVVEPEEIPFKLIEAIEEFL